MKHTLSFLLVFFFSQAFAQSTDYLAQYEFTFVQDSLHPKNLTKETMNLYLLKEKSFFISQKKEQRDSIYETDGNYFIPPPSGVVTGADFANNPRPQIIYTVLKDKKKEEFEITTRINPNNYEFTQPFNSFDWELKSDTLTVLGYLAHKAEVKAFGREFTAWYTMEIPISDGPYKFGGLPGLIVKLYDSQHYFDYELIGFQKTDNFKVWNESFIQEDLIKTTEKDYKALIRKYQNNPMAYFENTLASGAVRSITDDEDEIERRVKNLLSKNNNQIEKDLVLIFKL